MPSIADAVDEDRHLAEIEPQLALDRLRDGPPHARCKGGEWLALPCHHEEPDVHPAVPQPGGPDVLGEDLGADAAVGGGAAGAEEEAETIMLI